MKRGPLFLNFNALVMTLPEIAATCCKLMNTTNFHRTRMLWYLNEFNRLVKPGAETSYTPTQQFFERMTIIHFRALVEAERIEKDFTELAQNAFLQTERGQILTNDHFLSCTPDSTTGL
jgi:hypothetical protein